MIPFSPSDLGRPNRKARTTLRLVASAAGVHISTASAILNCARSNTRVSNRTRKRVKEAARRLAYVPNGMAQRLRTGRSNVVGFLGANLRNPFFAEFAAALESELARLNLQMVLSVVAQSDPFEVRKIVETLRQENSELHRILGRIS